MRKRAKFIYLISPNKINSNFYKELKEVLKTNKVKYFQLRLKKISTNKIIRISQKIKKICKYFRVKFIINDSPLISLKVGADGCHLGQSDMEIEKARKIIKKKIISELLKKKIIIRDLDSYGLKKFFRVSIGKDSEMNIFTKALESIIKKL